METVQNRLTDESRKIYGFDSLKFVLAVIVVATHVIQGYYPTDSVLYFISVHWLSKFVIPCFFMMSGYLLFRRVDLNQVDMGYIKKYVLKILKLYVVWSAIYLPINIYTWITNEDSIIDDIIHYIQNFLFASNIVQLWYLPALIIAVLIVALALKSNINMKLLLAVSFLIYLAGIIGDNDILKSVIPYTGKLSDAYSSIFVTTRNGFFYGIFFIAFGAYCAKTKARSGKLKHLVIFLLSVAAMLGEGFLLRSVNMFLFAVPASYTLFRLVENAQLKGEQSVYDTLRNTSSLMYYSHVLFLTGIKLGLELSGFVISGAYIILAAVVISIAVSTVVLKLQRYQYFHWLRILY